MGELVGFVRGLKMTRKEFGLLDDEMDKFARHQKKMFRDSSGRLRDERGRFAGLGGAADGAFGSIIGAVGAGTVLGNVLSSVGRMALDAGIALARMGAEAALAFGKATLDAAEFAQSTRMSLGMVLKDSAAGGKAFDDMRKLAARLGLDVRKTTEQFRDLLAMQFTMGQATDIVKMTGDMQALGAKADEVQRVIKAMTDIKAKGSLQMEELRSQLGDAKISTELVIAELAKMRKVGPDAIRKMITAGKIGADEGVQAVQLAVMQKLGIKRLGQAGEKFADSTIAGMKGRLKGAWENLWIDLGDKVVPALSKMKPIVDDILGALESPEAKKVIDAIGATIDGMVTTIRAAWPTVREFLAGFGKGFGKGFDNAMKALGPGLAKLTGNQENLQNMAIVAQALGEGLGLAAAGAAALVVMFANVGAAFDEAFGVLDFEKLTGDLKAAGTRLGTALVDGFVVGINTGTPRVTSAVFGLGSAATGGLTSALKIRSPSKVFAGLGDMTAAGFAQGVDLGAPQVDSAVTSMVAPPSAPSLGGSTTNQSVTFSPTIIVQGGDGSNTSEIEAAVRRAFEEAMREIAAQQGA
ncbi:putative phage tail protein [Virus Rctr16k]|nr:putative phage tail protein [Virus Rctr16k]